VSGHLSDQIAEAMTNLRQHQQNLRTAQEQLQKRKTSATARDRSVTVVVGSQGELREITFHTDSYRQMAPKELSDLLVKLTTQAREEMAGIVAETFAPLSGMGAALRSSLAGGSELDDVLARMREAIDTRPARHDEEEY
jgi:DNA-binding protein YbaB